MVYSITCKCLFILWCFDSETHTGWIRSTAHFANALFNKFSKQPGTPIQQMASLSTEADGDDSERKHVCPKPDCYKAYRQPSGLRYHIKHVCPPLILYQSLLIHYRDRDTQRTCPHSLTLSRPRWNAKCQQRLRSYV